MFTQTKNCPIIRRGTGKSNRTYSSFMNESICPPLDRRQIELSIRMLSITDANKHPNAKIPVTETSFKLFSALCSILKDGWSANDVIKPDVRAEIRATF